jgi:hypothetical protein
MISILDHDAMTRRDDSVPLSCTIEVDGTSILKTARPDPLSTINILAPVRR